MAKPLVRIAGQKLALEPAAGWTLESRPGGWIIATRAGADGKAERVRFQALELKGKLAASVRGRLYQGELIDEGRAAGGGGSDADLTAQFPGKVRKILVQAGARVAAGDPLVLVEAMKMEFAVKAPASGVVKAVLVKEGQQLSPGDRFVDFAPEGEKP